METLTKLLYCFCYEGANTVAKIGNVCFYCTIMLALQLSVIICR